MSARHVIRNIGAVVTYISGFAFIAGLIYQLFRNPNFGLMFIPESAVPGPESYDLANMVGIGTAVAFALFLVVGTLVAPLRLGYANYGEGLRFALTSTHHAAGSDYKTPLQVLGLAGRVAGAAAKGLGLGVVAAGRGLVIVARKTPAGVKWVFSTLLPVLGRAAVKAARGAGRAVPRVLAATPAFLLLAAKTTGRGLFAAARGTVRGFLSFLGGIPKVVSGQAWLFAPYGVVAILAAAHLATQVPVTSFRGMLNADFLYPLLVAAVGVFFLLAGLPSAVRRNAARGKELANGL